MIHLVKKNRLYLGLTLGIIFYPMIFVIVIIMMLDPEEQSFAFDKLSHFAVFSLLTFLIYFTISYQEKFWFLKKRRIFFTLISTLVIGLTIEFIQLYYPNRSTSIYDIIANLAGTTYTLYVIKHLPVKIKALKRYGI